MAGLAQLVAPGVADPEDGALDAAPELEVASRVPRLLAERAGIVGRGLAERRDVVDQGRAPSRFGAVAPWPRRGRLVVRRRGAPVGNSRAGGVRAGGSGRPVVETGGIVEIGHAGSRR